MASSEAGATEGRRVNMAYEQLLTAFWVSVLLNFAMLVIVVVSLRPEGPSDRERLLRKQVEWLAEGWSKEALLSGQLMFGLDPKDQRGSSS